MIPNKDSLSYLVIAVVILALGTYGYFRASVSPAPNLTVTPPSYDFGSITPEPAKKRFKLENTGNGVLRIERVSTSCSCTSAELTNRKITSGDAATLTVTFDPTAMEPPIKGEVLRIVYVQSNDPDREETKIRLTANVSGGDES